MQTAAVQESLFNALWFLKNRQVLMALHTLRSAYIEAQGELQTRIGRIISELETTRIAELA